MNKIAIFVEGQTELLFIERLLIEIASKNNIQIEKKVARGGRKSPRNLTIIEDTEKVENKKYFAMIVDCVGDSRVVSDIRERYDTLVKSGYQTIIGIRDVYPIKYDDIPKLRRNNQFNIKSKPVSVSFILAVMEIEAWFIAEHTHFQRINESLTIEKIKLNTGINPAVDDIQQLQHPSEILDCIYKFVGQNYTKRKSNVEKTIDKLDYAQIYLNLPDRFPDFNNLINVIESFLAFDPE